MSRGESHMDKVGTKIVKSFWGKSRGKVGTKIVQMFGGSRMEKLAHKLYRFVGEVAW